MKGEADAEEEKAKPRGEAEGTKAQLTARAEGDRELGEARAAEGEINLRQEVALALVNADVERMRHLAEALKGMGENMEIVQFSGGNGSHSGNVLIDTLMGIPEMAKVIDAKTNALSGKSLQEVLNVVKEILSKQENGPQEEPASQPAEKAE